MVLTKEELIGSLRHEIHILLHLASKVDRAQLGYKPTPKQRTTLELLQYLNIMGPQLVRAFKAGVFNGETWGAAVAASAALDYDALIASIGSQADFYEQELGAWTEADFRGEIEMFGQKSTRGKLVTTMILSGHAAYRMQLFCYLKSCGRDELSTMNLWAGIDGSM